MAREGRLAAAVLADERHTLARTDPQVDPVERPHAAVRIDVDKAFNADLRHRPAPPGQAGAGDARSLRHSPQPHGRWFRHPELDKRRVLEDLPSRAVKGNAPGIEDDDAGGDGGDEVGLLFGHEDGRSIGREPLDRLSHEARPRRVELRGRLVEDEVLGRSASRPAIATSCCWPPDSRRGSRSTRSAIRRASSAAHVRSTTSSRAMARFIGPKATSSNTVSVTCESCVAGFWNPIPIRSARRCASASGRHRLRRG